MLAARDRRPVLRRCRLRAPGGGKGSLSTALSIILWDGSEGSTSRRRGTASAFRFAAHALMQPCTWVWVFGRHDAVVYAVEPTRGHEVALELLKGFEGVFVCDGWSAYKTLGRKLPRASRAACWAHARLGFEVTSRWRTR